MKAKKFLKEWRRMCDSFDSKPCTDCPLENKIDSGCIIYDYNDDDINLVVKEVTKWSKKNRIKTYKDVFLEKFPNAEVNLEGTPQACLSNIFGVEHRLMNDFCASPFGCKCCWNREYKEKMNDE